MIRAITLFRGLIFVPLIWAAAAADRGGYVLGPEDQITIFAVEPQEITNKPMRVAMNGMVSLPLVGPVKAAGLTVEQFEAELAARLKPFVNRPMVSVHVTEYRSQPVSVLGAVNKPGAYQLHGRKTLVEMISAAEGLRQDAGTKVIVTRRKEWGQIPVPGAVENSNTGVSTAQIRLKDVTGSAAPENNLQIQPNDVIMVPRAEMVYVVGEVLKAGGYVLNEKEEISALKALALAGGVDKTASPGSARIIRGGLHSATRTEIPVNLNRILAGKAPDVAMLPEDILFVPKSVSKRAAFRTMEAALQAATGIIIYRR